MARVIVAAVTSVLLAGLALSAPAARGDWSGDANADVLAVDRGERLLLYRGNGAGGWISNTPEPIGTGWGAFTALLSPGDFNGDNRPDLLVRRADGVLLLYRGNGGGGWITGMGEPIGTGWGTFTALFSPGDFTGDGKPDVLARRPDGALLLYRGNGAGSWITGTAEPIGAGWQDFTAVIPGGDFSGDGKPDVLARQPDGALLLYRGNGAGGWITGKPERIGAGWGSLGNLTLAAQWRPPPAPPTPPAPPSAQLPDGRVRLTTGIRCTPPGGRLRVSLRIRRRAGRPAPRVLKVVFFARGGPQRVDRRAPYAARLRIDRPAGQHARVYARAYYRRAGSKRLLKKTVSRRFVMCR